MEDPTTAETLSAWADLVSLLLVGLAISTGGLDPRRRIWGRSPLHNTLITISMTLNILFSAARLILEGIYVAPGPREFLLTSIIYSARWLWLFSSITRPSTRPARAFHVARALRALKTLRLGRSSHPDRTGEPELVIRRGARVVKGDLYWRGVEEEVTEPRGDPPTYFVRLVEKELHATLLDALGTVQFKRKLETESNDGLYKTFYDLVMTVHTRNSNLDIDYTPFFGLNQHRRVEALTGQAQRVGAVDDTDIGDVARRVAADACVYIWFPGPNSEFRTKAHVDMINECIETAAKNFLGSEDNV